jgi:hypothetical protein
VTSPLHRQFGLLVRNLRILGQVFSRGPPDVMASRFCGSCCSCIGAPWSMMRSSTIQVGPVAGQSVPRLFPGFVVRQGTRRTAARSPARLSASMCETDRKVGRVWRNTARARPGALSFRRIQSHTQMASDGAHASASRCASSAESERCSRRACSRWTLINV